MALRISDFLSKRSVRGTLSFDGIPCAFLPSQARDKWQHAAENLTFPDSREPLKSLLFQQETTRIAHSLITAEMRELGHRLIDPQDKLDAVIFDDLPYEVFENPPKDGERPAGKSALSEALLAGIAGTLGLQLLGYKQEKGGDLFQNLAPKNNTSHTQSNETRDRLGYHVDNVFLPIQFQPEFLILLGLINENHVATLMLNLEQDILRHLPRSLSAILAEPMFGFASAQSFDLGGGTYISGLRPVIHTDEYGLKHISLPGNPYPQPTLKADLALRELRAILDSLPPHKIVPQAGRMLIFRNSRFVHGRDLVEGERWIQRVYCVRSLENFRLKTNSDELKQVFDTWTLLRK